MPISVSCPKCSARFNAPDSALGKKAKCGKCGEPFVVAELLPAAKPAAKPPTVAVAVRTPAPPAKRPEPPVPAQRPAAPIPTAVMREPAPAPAVATKDCPFCGESILLAAKKCKHCGEVLDVALRAAMTPAAPAPAPQVIHQMVAAPAAPAPAVHITNVNTNVVSGGYGPKRWSRIVAFFLSLLIPGLGQLYKGQLLNGLVWFIVVAIGYVAFIIPGVILHFCCALGAAMGDPYR